MNTTKERREELRRLAAQLPFGVWRNYKTISHPNYETKEERLEISGEIRHNLQGRVPIILACNNGYLRDLQSRLKDAGLLKGIDLIEATTDYLEAAQPIFFTALLDDLEEMQARAEKAEWERDANIESHHEALKKMAAESYAQACKDMMPDIRKAFNPASENYLSLWKPFYEGAPPADWPQVNIEIVWGKTPSQMLADCEAERNVLRAELAAANARNEERDREAIAFGMLVDRTTREVCEGLVTPLDVYAKVADVAADPGMVAITEFFQAARKATAEAGKGAGE
jgi:hypothetical protein